MGALKRLGSVLDSAPLYRLWQAPFVRQKLEPVFRHNTMRDVRRVLDVGCGPGTNAPYFANVDYLGVDLNEAYIEYARRRFGDRFVTADARTFEPPGGGGFDFILLNSFLHHIGDDDSRRLLQSLGGLLTDDGHIHVIDLVLPERSGVPKFLAQNDRGDHPRPLGRWEALLGESFAPRVFEPFALTAATVPLFELVYFKGQRRR